MPAGIKKLLPPFRNFSDLRKEAVKVVVSLGSAEGYISEYFKSLAVINNGIEINTEITRVKDEVRSADLIKMTPEQISQKALEIYKNANADAYVFPGSTNTIFRGFWDETHEMPKQPDIATARSFFKMAFVLHALSENHGAPSLYSCDGINYPILALGGKISEPPPIQVGDIKHSDGFHSSILLEGTWLDRLVKQEIFGEVLKDKLIARNIHSTHPLIMRERPAKLRVLVNYLFRRGKSSITIRSPRIKRTFQWL